MTEMEVVPTEFVSCVDVVGCGEQQEEEKGKREGGDGSGDSGERGEEAVLRDITRQEVVIKWKVPHELQRIRLDGVWCVVEVYGEDGFVKSIKHPDKTQRQKVSSKLEVTTRELSLVVVMLASCEERGRLHGVVLTGGPSQSQAPAAMGSVDFGRVQHLLADTQLSPQAANVLAMAQASSQGQAQGQGKSLAQGLHTLGPLPGLAQQDPAAMLMSFMGKSPTAATQQSGTAQEEERANLKPEKEQPSIQEEEDRPWTKPLVRRTEQDSQQPPQHQQAKGSRGGGEEEEASSDSQEIQRLLHTIVVNQEKQQRTLEGILDALQHNRT